MLLDEPGPFFVRELAPAPEWPAPPGHFARLGAAVVEQLGASEHILGAAARDVATVSDDGLDATYIATIGAAGDATDTAQHADDDPTAGVLIENGGAGDAHQAEVKRYLPPVDAPITTGFVDAPPAPTAGPGGDTNTAPSPDQPYG